jgi:hypothetical protein
MPTTATVPNGPSQVSSHACRPVATPIFPANHETIRVSPRNSQCPPALTANAIGALRDRLTMHAESIRSQIIVPKPLRTYRISLDYTVSPHLDASRGFHALRNARNFAFADGTSLRRYGSLNAASGTSRRARIAQTTPSLIRRRQHSNNMNKRHSRKYRKAYYGLQYTSS